jgi:hypothetical protein
MRKERGYFCKTCTFVVKKKTFTEKKKHVTFPSLHLHVFEAYILQNAKVGFTVT